MRSPGVPGRALSAARSCSATLAVLLAACIALTGCTRQQEGFRVEVDPGSALLDTPVSLRASGLTAGERIRVSARATDAHGAVWRSTATFVAPGAGVVTLRQASRGGTYRGRNPMGLFETMRPSMGSTGAFDSPSDGYDVRLSVANSRGETRTSVIRRIAPAGAGVRSRALTVAEDGVVGSLFAPKDTSRRRAAVLFFGGSEGGQARDFGASTTAAHGYTTISLAYFDTQYFSAPGLPQGLEAIRMEYFVSALRLLARQPGVDPDRVVIFAASRGTEMAQLLALHHPELVHALILGSPTDHVNLADPDLGRPAWTIDGAAVPSAAAAQRLTPDPSGTGMGTLSIARFAGPVLTVCGVQDEVWPSCSFAASIAARRRADGRKDDSAVRLASGSHAVDSADAYVSAVPGPGDPTSQAQIDTDAAARAVAREAVLRFLAKI